MLARYVHGEGSDTPQVWYEGAATTAPKYLFNDHQGSIVAVTDTTGVVTAINGYDEYGIPNATNVGRFQYTGQAWLPELGMYHYKARIYSPSLGRFLQTDPIGYADQINLYAYVGNDPVNATDSTGKCREITLEDGSKIIAGLCAAAGDKTSEDFVNGRLADIHSEIIQVEQQLVDARTVVLVVVGDRNPNGDQVQGGAYERLIINGTETGVVTIDPTNEWMVEGTVTSTGAFKRRHPSTIEDRAEHEIPGHLADELANRPNSEESAVSAENRRHVRRGDDFQRRGPNARRGRRL